MAEPSTKHTWMEESEDESYHALTDESNDDAMPDDVNEDPFNPFGYDDTWALSLFQKTFWTINIVVNVDGS